MKLKIETVIEGTQREGLAWGVTPEGEAVLVIIAGSRRVLLAMSAKEAIETGVGGCYVGQGLKMATSKANGETMPASALVDASGVPLGTGGRS